MSYSEIIESLPAELRASMARLVDALKEDLGVKKADFDELKAIKCDAHPTAGESEIDRHAIRGQPGQGSRTSAWY